MCDSTVQFFRTIPICFHLYSYVSGFLIFLTSFSFTALPFSIFFLEEQFYYIQHLVPQGTKFCTRKYLEVQKICGTLRYQKLDGEIALLRKIWLRKWLGLFSKPFPTVFDRMY